jgi:2-dehydro-3-deoxyphosphogluconate aldolase/(4S)-4-hydroxy-2-oxoglutarate aldolase
MDLHEFEKVPLLGILRGIRDVMVDPIVELSVSAGLRAIEITMNTEDAPMLIEKMVRAAGGRISVGAGTVLSTTDLRTALDAGATFIVLPTMIDEIVAACVEQEVPVFPGALTPSEIFQAWEAGATMVKVFPSNVFGPKYFREVKAPLQKIKLLACGGVNVETLPDFFNCGATAAAFGGSVFQMDLLEAKEYHRVGASLRTLVNCYLEWKEEKE